MRIFDRAEESKFQHIEVSRAPHRLRYDHSRPSGAVHGLYCFFSVILLMLLQAAFFSDGKFQLFGQGSSLVLVFVYLVSIKCSFKGALMLGLFSGLALDIFYGRSIGFYGLLFLYIALLVRYCGQKFLTTGLRTVLFAVPVFFVYRVTESFLARLLSLAVGGGSVLYTNYLRHLTVDILPCILYNEVVLLIMIAPVYALWRRFSPH